MALGQFFTVFFPSVSLALGQSLYSCHSASEATTLKVMGKISCYRTLTKHSKALTLYINHMDGLVQDCSISNANTPKILQSFQYAQQMADIDNPADVNFHAKSQYNLHIDRLVQERHNSIANALELRLSCTNLSIYMWCELSYRIDIVSMGKCKKDVTPLLTHWSCVFLALTIPSMG